MPFIGAPDFWDIPKLIITVISELLTGDMIYIVFVFPFIFEAFFLAFITHKCLPRVQLNKIIAQLTGGFTSFIPYAWFGFGVFVRGNAPQSLGVIIVPISAIVGIPVLYGIGYFAGLQITKHIFETEEKNKV